MNCALALRMLDAYVDEELDAATVAEMAEHLVSCAACADLRDRRLAMRAVLRTAALRHAVPAELRNSILHAIESADRPAVPPRSMHWWQALVLGGSTAVLGGLGGWWVAQPSEQPQLPDVVVARHVASLAPAGPRIDVASSDRHTVRPWFQGRVDFAPAVRDLSAAGFDLVGGRVERVGERPSVAIVYRLHDHIIEVFSWRRLADAPRDERQATIRGFNVIAWTDHDIDYLAVSDTDPAELRRFTAAYRAQ